MSKFSYEVFHGFESGKLYGLMVHQKKYTREEALELGAVELETTVDDLEVYTDRVKYMVNRPEEQGPGYQTCDPNERGSFLCWCVRIKEDK